MASRRRSTYSLNVLVAACVVTLGLGAFAWLTGPRASDDEVTTPGPGEVVRSPVAARPAAEADPRDLTRRSRGTTRFTFALWDQLPESGNLAFAPLGISTALSMVHAGARGETRAELGTALHRRLPFDRFHTAAGGLSRWILGRGHDAVELNMVDDVWLQRGLPIRGRYLDTLARDYAAGVHTADFRSRPGGVADEINAYVSDATRGRVRRLLPDGALDRRTRLVLTDATYFKARWAKPFDPKATRPGSFHALDGSVVEAALMRGEFIAPAMRGEGYTAVSVPYEGGFAMLIVVPDAGTFEGWQRRFDDGMLTEIERSLRETQVDLTLPRFDTTRELTLRDPLRGLGIRRAFDERLADLSGIADGEGLFLAGVRHQALVSADERGTEAAAATSATVGTTALPARQLTVRADRPFVYLIRERASGTILFAGRVASPRT